MKSHKVTYICGQQLALNIVIVILLLELWQTILSASQLANFHNCYLTQKLLTKSWIKLTVNDCCRAGDSSRGRFFVFSFSDALVTRASEPSTTSEPLMVAKLLQMLLNTGWRPDYQHAPDTLTAWLKWHISTPINQPVFRALHTLAWFLNNFYTKLFGDAKVFYLQDEFHSLCPNITVNSTRQKC